jgi:hypothetical protein
MRTPGARRRPECSTGPKGIAAELSWPSAQNGVTPRRDGDQYHEGALTVSRRPSEATQRWLNAPARLAVRVKYGDHGVRLPRVAGRQGRGLATPPHCDAKEPLARPHYASCTRHRIGSTRRRGTFGAGVIAGSRGIADSD